jgi:hypothetical protein
VPEHDLLSLVGEVAARSQPPPPPLAATNPSAPTSPVAITPAPIVVLREPSACSPRPANRLELVVDEPARDETACDQTERVGADPAQVAQAPAEAFDDIAPPRRGRVRWLLVALALCLGALVAADRSGYVKLPIDACLAPAACHPHLPWSGIQQR